MATLPAVREAASDATLTLVLGCTLGALFAAAAGMVLYMYSREKQGEPVFEAAIMAEEEVKDLN